MEQTVRELFVTNCVTHTVLWVRVQPVVEKVNGSTRLSCNTGCQKIGRCPTGGEFEDCTGDKAHKSWINLVLKPVASQKNTYILQR